MITEDYVSFETAKLLKKKGFYQDFLSEITPVWKLNGNRTELAFYGCDNYPCETDEWYSAPILQLAMKWLREKHNLHIITLPYAPIDRNPYHPGEADVVYIAQLFKGIIPIDKIGRSVIKLTPEQACEAAIRYTLENLI